MTTVSRSPAARKTAPIANGVKPPSSSWSGTSTTSVPKSQAGRVFSQSPPRKPSVGEGAADGAAATCCFGRGAGREWRPSRRGRLRRRRRRRMRRRSLTASATAPNIGPRMAPKTAAPKAVPISSPRRSRGAATVSQARAPAQVIVLEAPWTKPGEPERPRALGGGERKAGCGEEGEPGDDGALRPASRARRARRGCRRAARRRRRSRRAARRRSSRARTRPRSRGSSGASAPNSIASTNTTTRDENQKRGAQSDVTRRQSPDRSVKAASSPVEHAFRGLGAKRDPLPRLPFPIAPQINSASRVRFRPPHRRTFGFRLRPPVWTRPTRVPCSLQGGI